MLILGERLPIKTSDKVTQKTFAEEYEEFIKRDEFEKYKG
jgi:hypothetical protein